MVVDITQEQLLTLLTAFSLSVLCNRWDMKSIKITSTKKLSLREAAKKGNHQMKGELILLCDCILLFATMFNKDSSIFFKCKFIHQIILVSQLNWDIIWHTDHYHY